MKGCVVLVVWMSVALLAITAISNLLQSQHVPDNTRALVFLAMSAAVFLGIGLIAQVNTDKSKLSDQQIKHAGDVSHVVFVFFPLLIALVVFAFIVLPAMQSR